MKKTTEFLTSSLFALFVAVIMAMLMTTPCLADDVDPLGPPLPPPWYNETVEGNVESETTPNLEDPKPDTRPEDNLTPDIVVEPQDVIPAGWYKTADGATYYYQDGLPITGWLCEEDTYYFFDKAGKMVVNDWVEGRNGWHCFDENGAMYTGLQYVDFGRNDDGWYYFDQNDGENYGRVMTGWQKIGPSWYYFSTQHNGTFGRAYTDGWYTINGSHYCFGNSGRMAANQWIPDADGNVRFVGPQGDMYVGLRHIGTTETDAGWYYFNPQQGNTYGCALTGWQDVPGAGLCMFERGDEHWGTCSFSEIWGQFDYETRRWSFGNNVEAALQLFSDSANSERLRTIATIFNNKLPVNVRERFIESGNRIQVSNDSVPHTAIVAVSNYFASSITNDSDETLAYIQSLEQKSMSKLCGIAKPSEVSAKQYIADAFAMYYISHDHLKDACPMTEYFICKAVRDF